MSSRGSEATVGISIQNPPKAALTGRNFNEIATSPPFGWLLAMTGFFFTAKLNNNLYAYSGYRIPLYYGVIPVELGIRNAPQECCV